MTALRKKIAVFAVAIAAVALPVIANAAGTTGALFLNVGVSARSEAMGGAYTAIADDASAVTINPGGMMQVKDQQVTLMHNESYLDINQEYFAYVKNMGKRTYGGSLVYMDFGNQAERSASNTVPFGSSGVFNSSSYALSFAYGANVSKIMSYGVALKYIKSKIAEYADSTFALDAGLLYKPTPKGLRGALTLTNLGTGLKLYQNADPLPLTLKLGGAYEFEEYPLIISSDIYMIRDEDAEFHLGAQYTVAEIVPIRIGYNSDDDLDNGFSYGIGVVQPQFSLDYAFVPAGDFDDTHRFSVIFNF